MPNVKYLIVFSWCISHYWNKKYSHKKIWQKCASYHSHLVLHNRFPCNSNIQMFLTLPMHLFMLQFQVCWQSQCPLFTQSSEKMEFDVLLTKIGEFGAYQQYQYFFLCLVGIPAAFHNLGYVFWAARPDHWCAPPLHTSPAVQNQSQEAWKQLAIPWDQHQVSGSYLHLVDTILCKFMQGL